MRGKVDVMAVVYATLRITPAYAGKRNGGVMIVDDIRDHPRICGEKTKKIP